MAFLDKKLNVDALSANTYRTAQEIADVTRKICRYASDLEKKLSESDVPDEAMKHLIVETRKKVDVSFLQLFDSVLNYQHYVSDFRKYMENNNVKC